MASQHELRITATLDTSQLNQQLDALNAQRSSSADDTTGNGISIGMRMKQLQMSLDTLNRTLQSIDKFNRGMGQHIPQSGGLLDGMSSSSMAGIMGAAQRGGNIATVTIRAQLLKQMFKNSGVNLEAGFNRRYFNELREAVLKDSVNQDLARLWKSLGGGGSELGGVARSDMRNRIGRGSNLIGQQEMSRRDLRMGLAMAGHFSGMIGQSLQDAGYDSAGAGFNVIGNTLGAAASGAMAGGPWGAAIGGLVGLTTSLTAEMRKLQEAAQAAAEALYQVQKKEMTSYIDYKRDTKMDALSKAVEASLKKPEDLANYQRQIEESRKGAQLELFNARQLYERFHNEAQSIQTSKTVSSDIPWILGGGNVDYQEIDKDAVARKTEATERALEQLKEVQSAQAALEQWDGLAKRVKDAFQAMVDETERNHQEGLRLQKMEEDFRFQLLEEEKRNEETRKNLLMQREYILLQMEQDYMQQGVDVLSQMGKQGKFMSMMESQSVNQERYSPITKKLDTMQKSLDHLSQIDAKLRNLNIGLQ